MLDMNMPFDELKRAIGKKRMGTINKIRNCWGVFDYYKFYRKVRPKQRRYALSSKDFYTVIREVNKLLADSLVRGETLVFPYNLGKIQAERAKVKDTIEDGKLKTTRRVDWNATLKLWHEDHEAYKKKTLMRIDFPYNDSLKYTKREALFNNKAFYRFKVNRDTIAAFMKANKTLNNKNLYMFDDSEIITDIKGLYNG